VKHLGKTALQRNKNLMGLAVNGNYICNCGEKLEMCSITTDDDYATTALRCPSEEDGIHSSVILEERRRRNRRTEEPQY
jgi:hypothetical protein